MQGFVVELKNRPGELARIAETISSKGINITGFTGATCGDTGSVCILTNDDAATRRALKEAHYKAHERDLVVAAIKDKPGSLAECTRRLANAGCNVEAALPIGMDGRGVHVAFATDDAVKARAALGDMALAGAIAL